MTSIFKGSKIMTDFSGRPLLQRARNPRVSARTILVASLLSFALSLSHFFHDTPSKPFCRLRPLMGPWRILWCSGFRGVRMAREPSEGLVIYVIIIWNNSRSATSTTFSQFSSHGWSADTVLVIQSHNCSSASSTIISPPFR